MAETYKLEAHKMKKLMVIAIVVLACLTLAFSQPIIDPIEVEPIIVQNVVKIDDQTCEITTTTTTETVIRYDRAELQTVDHIPDRKAEIQKQLDVVNEREAELIEILKVFK